MPLACLPLFFLIPSLIHFCILNATSFDVYNDKQSFVVVHYLDSKSRAQGLVELLAINKDIEDQITKENTILSSENYKVIQLHKNLEDYIQQSTK